MSVLLRNCLQQSLLVAQKHAAPKATLISGPPKVKISALEKYSLATVMVLCVCMPSGVLLARLKTYKKSD